MNSRTLRRSPKFTPRRVQILSTEGGYFKPGQFAYVVGSTKHGGMFLMDGGQSKDGQITYLVSKSKGMSGGALWFSKKALRFTKTRSTP